MLTATERRIIEFLFTAPPTEVRDFPDWLLERLGCDGEGNPSAELLTTGTLLLVRREHPALKAMDARRLASTYLEPDRIERTLARLLAFSLACSFERLRRAGLIADVEMNDIFDLNGNVLVKLHDDDARFFASHPSEAEKREWMRTRLGLSASR
jgi:hypothetical protein